MLSSQNALSDWADGGWQPWGRKVKGDIGSPDGGEGPCERSEATWGEQRLGLRGGWGDGAGRAARRRWCGLLDG